MQQYFQKLQNRGQLSPDARPLKRHQRRGESSRQSGGVDKSGGNSAILYPDVYPQQEKQEEDNLSTDRLTKGYQIEVIHSALVRHEYDSLIKSSRVFMSDDQLYRTARWIKQLLQKKSELNAIWLDKNWLKENNVRGFIPDSKREEFFESLISGRKFQKDNKRHSLAACFPRFVRTSYDQLNSMAQQKLVPLCDAMNLLYEKGVPIQKAIWFLKMNQIAHPILVTSSKQKKGSVSSDDYASDQRQFFIRYMRCLLREYDKAIPGQLEQNSYYQRWPYVAALVKHSFEDGMLDRHEFIWEMCELLTEFSSFSMGQPQTFRILIILMTQFTDLVTQNIFIARRLAHILCKRLAQYKRDYEKIRSQTPASPPPQIPANVCFEDLANCQHHRPTLLIIFGFLHAIILDCPSALVWTPFEPADLLEGSQKGSSKMSSTRALERENALQSVAWLCGSPLDHLPCKVETTTQHLAKPTRESIDKMLQERIEEIKERSQFVESRWAFINPSNEQAGIERIVGDCLDILAMLDTVPLDQPNAIKRLYEQIFPNKSKGPSASTLEVRVQMLIQWAVSSEREGSHRALFVAKLLKKLSSEGGKAFGEYKSLHQLLIACLNRDWAPELMGRRAKGEEKSSPSTNKSSAKKNGGGGGNGQQKRDDAGHGQRRNAEFGNLVQLFYELQRFGLFNHDRYVRALMRNGTFGHEPLYQRLKRPAQQPKLPEQVPAAPVKPPESQMIISFIPTTPTLPPSSTSQQQQKPEDFAKLLPEHELDQHPFLDGQPELSFHERFLLHLPIEQKEANRDACNQRAIVLYAISEQREQAKQDLRKIAREICKIWKKSSVEVVQSVPNTPVRELRYRRRCTNEQIAEAMGRFRQQTYYDQLVICGWCAEGFVDSLEDFLRQLNEQMEKPPSSSQSAPLLAFPTGECLDMLCEMMELGRSLHSLVTLSAELLPFLVEIEQLFRRNYQQFYIDCIPGSLTAQLAYVLVARLVEHFHYFLYSPEACSVFNDLYALIKWDLLARREQQQSGANAKEQLASPLTGWARAIASFCLHGRNKLLGAELYFKEEKGEGEGRRIVPLFGTPTEMRAVFPAPGTGSLARNLNYQKLPLADQLSQPSLHNLRFFPFQELRARLQAMQSDHSKYSFVQDAFKAACACGHDYERLVELANFCANMSAQLGLETEWCNAVQELCHSNVSSNNNNWNEMLLDIDGNNFSTHSALSTFVLLLASKQALSAPSLISRLIDNVFGVVIREEGGFYNENLEHGICLAMHICTALVCGTHIPFTCTGINTKGEAGNGIGSRKDCHQYALRSVHLAELGPVVLPLLTLIMQLVDELKRRVEASKKDPTSMRRYSQQLAIARCALLSMCEQDWLIQHMFALCAADPEVEQHFGSTRLKHQSIGQQLLRIALRRKSERRVKQELMECTSIAIYEKLLSALTVWNMRATYFDLKLIIDETFPTAIQKLSIGSQQLANHHHMIMFLFNNIATACHQLFLSRLTREAGGGEQEEAPISLRDFRPSSIDCYWLIAPLASAMPSPPPPTGTNSQNPHWCPWVGSAMKAYFLKVVAENLKAPSEGKEARNKLPEAREQPAPPKYEQLLAYQPFLNLVMACTEGEDVKQLLDTLLDYVDDIVARVRRNPIVPHQSYFLPEREGLILRLNLLTGLFNHLTTNANAESWASALFQLLFFEVLTQERDTDYFDTCLDMLTMLAHKIYPHRSYNTFVGKFKNLRIPEELYPIQQLLPIPKSQAELSAWDSFSNSTRSTASPQTGGGGKGSSGTSAQQSQQQIQPSLPMAKPQIQGIIIDKHLLSVEKKILRMLKHDHWMQRHTDPNGQTVVTFIPRPGLPGEEKIRPDPFLAAPEMEQVATVQEISEEEPQRQMAPGQPFHQPTLAQQQQLQQEQQQRIQQQQQQQSAMQQQIEAEQQQQQHQQHLQQQMQIRAYQQQQQQQVKMEMQQPVMGPGQGQGGQPAPQQQQQVVGGMQGMGGGMQPAHSQQQQHFQPMLQQHQQMMPVGGGGGLSSGMGEPTAPVGPQLGGPPSFIPTAGQVPILNLLQQGGGGNRGSGSSTPAGTDSPAKTGAGRGGGRRKSQTGSNQPSATGGAGRGQKRKKEAVKQQQQQPMAAAQMMGGGGMGGEMFGPSGAGPAGPMGGVPAHQGAQQPQMSMAAMMQMQQQQQQQQMHQQQLQWQMQQRQGAMAQQQPGAAGGGQPQGQPTMMGTPMLYGQQQPPPMAGQQQPPQQFRPQMGGQQPQPPPPQYQPPQQQQQSAGRQFIGQQQMATMPGAMMGVQPQGMMAPQQQAPPAQQQQPISDIKKQINAKIMQKQNQKAQQQQQQIGGPGMGGMGMPGGP